MVKTFNLLEFGSLILLFISGFSTGYSQVLWENEPLWIKELPVKAIALDKLEQAYVLSPDGVLQKYSPTGVLLGTFSRKELGEPAYMDVSDPQQVLLWYPDFQTLILLDRLLTPYHVIRLSGTFFPQPAVVALGRENQIWVYDRFLYTLYKLDRQGNPLGASVDISLTAAPPPNPTMLVAGLDGVYLADPKMGIWFFDRLGQHQFTRYMLGVDYIQPLPDGVLLIRQSGQFALLSAHLKDSPLLLAFPSPCVALAIQAYKILVGTSEKLLCYPAKKIPSRKPERD